MTDVSVSVCSLIVKGRCKYEPFTHNCIPTININEDVCSTPGINSEGCQAVSYKFCQYEKEK